MTEILVLQFANTCHLGAVGDVLEARDARTTPVRVDKGEPLPDGPGHYDGIVLLGGPQYAEDDEKHPWLAPTATLARAFHDAGRPALGICLGSQIIARALDARVRKHHLTELGFTELTFTEAAAEDPLLRGLEPRQSIMQFHEDTFDLPAGATLLMTGEHCANQAFRQGTSWGFQCHFEATRAVWLDWWPEIEGVLRKDHPDYHASWEQDFARHEAGAKAFCATVSARWLQQVEARAREAA